MNRWLVFAAALAGVCISGQAAIIDGVTVTTTMGSWVTYTPTHLTDGSGLSQPVSLASVHDADYTHMWMSSGPVSGALVFDLGQERELTSIAIWQYNVHGLTERGVKTYSLDISDDGLSYTQLQAPAQLPIGTGLNGLAPTVIGVQGNTQARYVRMNIVDSWGTSQYVGLSEVQFAEPTMNVPEPTAASAVLAASVGLLIRKRKNKA